MISIKREINIRKKWMKTEKKEMINLGEKEKV